MKKLLTVILILSVMTIAIPVHATAVITNNTMTMQLDAPALISGVTPVEIEEYFDADGHTTSTVEPFVYTYLKAKVDDPHIYVKFTVAEDAIYDIVIEVMASTSTTPRTGLAQIDDSEKVYMSTEHGDRVGVPEYFVGMQAELSAGEHIMRLFLGDDFDDSTVKSLFLDKFYVVKTAEIATVTVAEETTTPEDVAVVEPSAPITTTAPQTSDTAYIFETLLILSAALLVTVKHKKMRG